MKNRGKDFEKRFERDFKSSFPLSTIIRLPDQISYYKQSSRNVCDYICFTDDRLFLVECKETIGNTFNWAKFKQYDIMLSYKDNYHVVPIIIIWFIDHDKILATRVDEIEKMKQDGLKSININHLGNYQILDIPSVKKRVYLESDYKAILELER